MRSWTKLSPFLGFFLPTLVSHITLVIVMKLGIQELHRKYVFVPADKAANISVVIRRLHYI